MRLRFWRRRPWPVNPYDEWTVKRALKLARGVRDRWGNIPDAEGRVPGVQFFALVTLAAEVERLRSRSAAPGLAATSTQGEASAEGNDAETGAA